MHVSRPVAIAFTVALIAALMGVAYLLGLDHARRHQIIEQTPPNPSVSVQSEVAPVAPAPPAAPPAAAMPSAVIEQATSTTVAPPASPSPPPPSLPPSAVRSPDTDAVRNYFQQMDLLAGVNPFGDDSAGAAQQMLASAMGGDSSGFDGIAKVATDAVTKAQAIVPPAACAHYHAELVKSLQESVQMLTSIKAAMVKKDTGELMSVASSAGAMKSRLDALTNEAQAIKAKYGLR